MNEHQLFMFPQKPKHLSRQGPDVEQTPGGGAKGWGDCPPVSSKVCHFWEGAVLLGGGLSRFEGAWDSLAKASQGEKLLSAVPTRLF